MRAFRASKVGESRPKGYSIISLVKPDAERTCIEIISVTAPKMVGGTDRKKRRLAPRPISKRLSWASRAVYDSSSSYPPAWKEMRSVKLALGSRASSLMLAHCLVMNAWRSTALRP